MELSRIPSPCYVIDEASLRRNLALIRKVGQEAGVEIIVALKAFAGWGVFPIFKEYIGCAAASSVNEARLAFEELGTSAHAYAPVYTTEDFPQIMRYSSHITFNSLAQFQRFYPQVKTAGSKISCGLRINPGFSAVGTGLYDPCAPGSRLGVTAAVLDAPGALPEGTLSALRGGDALLNGGLNALPEGIPDTLPKTNKSTLPEGGSDALPGGNGDTSPEGGLNAFPKEIRSALPDGIEGFHFHTLCESDSYALAATLEVVEQQFGRFFPYLKWINMGGGHLMTREGYDTAHLISVLRDFRRRYPHLHVILEPGSAFTWDAGVLVATVEDIVENDGITTAMLDVSFACHMPDCLEMPYKPVIEGATDAQVGKPAYRMGGNSCLAGDFAGEWSFDAPLKPGDKVVFRDMVHYTMVKTTTFNGVAHPSIGLWTCEGDFRLLRRFGYGDFKSRLS